MPRPPTDLRHRVLRAARRTFETKGYDGASLRAIARAAGTTIGMIYYYFPTKDALWDGVIDEVYQRFVHDLAGLLASPGSMRERLRAIAAHVAALSEDDRALIRLVLRDALVSPERRARVLARFQVGHIPLLFGAIARAQADGELVDAPTPIVMFLAGAAVLGSQLLLGNLPLPGLPDSAARIEHVLDLLFAGVGKRPDRSA